MLFWHRYHAEISFENVHKIFKKKNQSQTKLKIKLKKVIRMTQFENSFSFTRLLNCEMYQLTDDANITGDIFQEYNRTHTNRI